MIDLGELFPKAIGKPITVKSLYSNVLAIRSYGAGYKIKWLDSNRPHPTIGKDHSQKPTRWRIDDLEHRPTTEELANISSFPSKFLFSGNANENWNRIGNSVPPLLMYAIATQIKHKLWGGEKLKPMDKKIDYPVHLEMMWQKHLEPRQPDAPTVISTFAGGGGSSLGYSMAGFRELLAVEWDNNAVETFKLNFPDVPVYHGDIVKLSVDECLELAGVAVGELDIFDGSPPCQGFSTAGKRNLDDPRNQLFREYVRLLQGLKPKVFVMENVSGMVKGKMKLVFAEILRELRASGYKVSARLLNAMYFHVPQSRQRMIFIGVREDLGIEPSHPGAESRPVTVRKAIIKCNNRLDAPKWREFNLNLWKSQSIGQNGLNGSYFNHVRMNFDKPSPTIPKSCVFGGFAGLYNETTPRSLNLGELARLGSFPDKFEFIGNYEMGLERIGNSVPPLMMEAIARNIKEKIL